MTADGGIGRLTRGWAQRIKALWRVIAKFGTVGLLAFIVDIGLFNLLMFAGPGGDGILNHKPITSKIISVVVATTFAFLLNRSWTFRDRPRGGVARQYVSFFVANGIGLVVTLIPLWITIYLLGLTSPLATNIAANVVGLALGTMFRFWAYHKYVFPAEPQTGDHSALEAASV